MKRNVIDPVRKFGGKPLPPYLALVLVPLILTAGGASWYYASSEGGFEEVDRLASVKCLGCLGLDPVIPAFTEFWTVYPEDHVDAGDEVNHPEPVHEILGREEVDIFVLFFWTQGCVPCAEQWDEMVEEDIASGPEDGGVQGDRYDRFRMISIDAADDENGFYMTYRPTGLETGVPMTTFLFKDTEGTVRWYSHYGKMSISDFEERIEDVKSFLEASRIKDDYDDISTADDHH
jgi:hypothetical protein